MVKILPLILFLMFSISTCDGWSANLPTFPAPDATITSVVLSPTPLIITATNVPLQTTTTDTITETNTPKINIGPISNFSATVTFTPTSVPYKDNIIVRIIGCNTGFDIRHGMGEVTNGFVELQNQTGIDLTNLCTTLFAIDEGRLHPDKTMCTPVLKHDYQVTLMLTVDSTYKQATLIQVEVSSQGNLLSRVDRISCIDIEYLSSKPDIFMTPVQIK